jgi:hypothetical protein
MLRGLLSLSILLLLFAPQDARAEQSRWQNLEQVRTGQKVTVIVRDHRSISGTFLRFSNNDLTLHVGDSVVKINRDDVSRITVKGGHRGRNALIGFLAVGGFGAIAGAAANHNSGADEAAAFAGFGLGTLGAGIGALIPGSKTIYRVDEGKGDNSGRVKNTQ